MKNFEFYKTSNQGLAIDILEAICYNNITEAHQLGTHKNDGIELCIAFEGAYDWVVEGESARIGHQEISITMPWQKHSGKNSFINKGKLGWLIITPEILYEDGTFKLGDYYALSPEMETAIGKILCGNRHINIGKSEWFIQLFYRLMDEIKERKTGYKDAIRACITDMLIEVLRMIEEKNNENVRDQSVSNDRTSSVLAAIDDAIDKNWSIEDLETLTHLKKTALTKYFKGITGYSPINYVMFRKIEYSKQLLTEDQLSITDIAYRLNFSSSQHYSTTFKKFTGDSPKTYRTSHSNQ